ncbi:MAG: FIST N-terminal domain-containing protein [Myxococcota bacterium]
MFISHSARNHRTTDRLTAVHARTVAPDPDAAIDELARALFAAPPGLMLVFVAPQYDLGRLGRRLATTFPQHTVVGCTSAGQIGRGGFHVGGITAAVISSPELCATPYLLSSLEDPEQAAADLGECLPPRGLDAPPAFGMLLVDGLSRREERLSAAIRGVVGDLPFVGGSAGDNLHFEATHILHDGKFLEGAALFVLFETSLPFATFHFHDVVPTHIRVRVTRTDAEGRTIHELDGQPAAEVYARLIKRPLAELTTAVFADHPWLCHIEGTDYVRSVGRALPDGSLYLLCAVADGDWLTLGARGDGVVAAAAAFDAVRDQVAHPAFAIGFDCVLRRLDLETRGVAHEVEALLSDNHVVGFSTYGEQIGGVHVNQTFTGVVLGR